MTHHSWWALAVAAMVVFTAQPYPADPEPPGGRGADLGRPPTPLQHVGGPDWPGRLVGGSPNPARGSIQRLVEPFEPWYVSISRPATDHLGAPTMGLNQPSTAHVQVATATTLKYLRIFRLASTTHSGALPTPLRPSLPRPVC